MQYRRQLWIFPLFLLLGMIFFHCGGGGGEGGSTDSGESGTIGTGNFFNNGVLHSGFIIGTATATVTGFTVRVSFDGGAFTNATGTSSWSAKLPNIVDDAIVWGSYTSHTIRVQVLSSTSEILVDETFTVKRGINRDFNGDGYSDVVVGAYVSDLPGTNRGTAYIYHGSTSGVSTTANRTLSYPETDNSAGFGYSVSAAGDVNGDGYGDVIIGAYLSDLPGNDRGTAYVFHGSSSGIPAAASTTLQYPGADNGAQFGGSVSSAGDVNADGYDDVVVGAILSDIPGLNSGVAYVFHGSGTGVSTTANTTMQYPEGDTGAVFGVSVSNAGDVNNDGFGDVLVGAYLSDLPGTDRGVAYVYEGSGTGVPTTPDTTIQYPETDNGAQFGISVSLAGDVNNDGFSDVVVGAHSSNLPGTNRGTAYVHHGSGTGVSTTASSTLQYPGADDAASFGFSVDSAGDVNKDGFEDVVVGANNSDIPGTDRGVAYVFHGSGTGVSTTASSTLQYPETDDSAIFGVSVSLAGDVSGDGFSDIIIGAFSSDLPGFDRGTAYVYNGSSSGTPTTASATLQYPETDDSARFGFSVSLLRKSSPTTHP